MQNNIPICWSILRELAGNIQYQYLESHKIIFWYLLTVGPARPLRSDRSAGEPLLVGPIHTAPSVRHTGTQAPRRRLFEMPVSCCSYVICALLFVFATCILTHPRPPTPAIPLGTFLERFHAAAMTGPVALVACCAGCLQRSGRASRDRKLATRSELSRAQAQRKGR